METYGIGLIGCGTVGSGVARILLEHTERLTARTGKKLQLRRVLVRDPAKRRQVELPPGLVTTRLEDLKTDPNIQVVAELAGGVDWPRRAVLELLEAGKDIVTANKALLAEHGAELFDAGRRFGRAIAFEASVAGGVPIITALTQSLAANQITAVQAILNGTSNFILTGMSEENLPYRDALAEAQRLGYAEADPTLDVDGTDAAQKLAILAQIAFGVNARLDSFERRGIAEIDSIDIQYARELGYTIKLLAEAWLSGRKLALHVSPVLLRKHDPLALVRGPYNAIHLVGDVVGDTLFYGRGAGQMPTASAVVADLIDMAVGRAHNTFRSLRLWCGNGGNIELQPSSTVRSRFYLRMFVEDRPGVLAQICTVLANYRISITSLIQHEALEDHEGDIVPLVIMTHTASTADFRAAVADLADLPFLRETIAYYPVAD
ncbi:MAG: homoserine dehydrogenase [Gemmatales bacterium]|nr:MAG: homoserine dehydrogenase [Gemmatales bacterium]